MKKLIPPAFALLALACAGIWWWQRPIPLSERDYMMVGLITNASGEPLFDGSLQQALRVALAQSPYLNLLSEQKARQALKKIGKPDGEPITPAVAKLACAEAGAKAYLTGNIQRSGSSYVIELEVRRCPDGARMAQAETSAAREDLVVHHLGEAAIALREQLGESKDSIRKLDCPLERATTPIPAALKAYEQARTATREKGDLEAIPFYKKAIELDSRFALARSGLAVSYYNSGQLAQASEEIRQAYEAADRQTYRERLNVATLYDDLAQGDIDKAIEGYKEFVRAYPRDDVAMGNLSSEFFVTGDYEQGAQYAAAALKIDPDSAAWYENYSTALMALSRLDEAEKCLREAFARKLDDPALHANLYSLGFLKGDKRMMEEQAAWAAARDSGQDSMLASESDTEAYFGRMHKARDLMEQAVQAAQKSELPESAALWRVAGAMREAMIGASAEAHKDAEEALKLSPESKDVRAMAALVFARVGDEVQATAIMDDLRASYVSNMAIQKAWLPVVRAELALGKKQNEQAVKFLESVLPYEKGQLSGNLSDSCMIPAYLRGEAYLGLAKNREALAEFRKIETFPGITGSCWSGPLAKLQAARAAAQAGSTADAKTGYQQFFELWKDADSDVPILKAAKLESARLH